MGCGGSRPNAKGEKIPAKLRPILRRQIEEIRWRKRSSVIKETTPSKKELLVDHDNENDEKRENITSRMTPEDSKGLRKKVERDVTNKEESPEAKNKDDEKEEKQAKVTAKGSTEVDDNYDYDIEDEGDTEEREDENKGSIIFPRSPSFRIYFVDNLDDIGKKDGANEKTQSSDYKASTKMESAPKKEKNSRKRSLKKVIPKGGQTAVKNLFNVSSCYTSSNSTHDHSHLLPEKSPA